MAKFYGEIGYASGSHEDPSRAGVWIDTIVKKNYSGDVIRNYGSFQEGETVTDELRVSNTISIVADPFAMQNFSKMRYIVWMGVYWKITKVEPIRPRFILTIGGVYNGPKG